MPVRNKVQVYFDTENDAYVPPVTAYEHHIGIYPIATKEVLHEWHRQQADGDSRRLADELSKELFQYWLAAADQLRLEYRHLAAIDAYRKALRLVASPEVHQKLKDVIADRVAIDESTIVAARQIRHQQFQEAAHTLEGILQRKPDLASAHGKLGTVYATLGKRDQAVAHLNAVAQFDPDDAYGEGMLGWMAYLDGKFDVALEHYQRADEIEPYKAKIQHEMGLAYSNKQSWDEAKDRFRLALTIDPRHADSAFHLSQVLRAQGELTEATEFARRAVRITERKQPEILLHLAECLAEGDQLDEARRIAADAIDVAQRNHPELVPRIRRRIGEFRDR